MMPSRIRSLKLQKRTATISYTQLLSVSYTLVRQHPSPIMQLTGFQMRLGREVLTGGMHQNPFPFASLGSKDRSSTPINGEA